MTAPTASKQEGPVSVEPTPASPEIENLLAEERTFPP